MRQNDHSVLGLLADILGLVAGLTIAFSGYRLLRNLAGLAGFLTGFVLGLVFGTLFTLNPILGLVVGVGLGILLALLFVFAFRFVGAVLGGFLGATLATVLGWGGFPWLLLVLAGIVLGLVANKLLIVLATAVEGGWLAASSGLSLLDAAGVKPDNVETVTLIVAGGIALIGTFVQLRHLRQES